VSPSRHVDVRINLARLRANAAEVRAGVGVPVMAVVKADAYGHGAAEVVAALADVADEFCVFALREAIEARIFERTGKRTLAIGPPLGAMEPDDYRAHGVRPAVTTAEEALQLAGAGPALCVDAGMQRFACPPERADGVIRAGGIREAYTHATSPEHLRRFLEAVGGRGLRLHAAGSSLLHEPAARLDAVRPGLALYRGAARVTARLVEARDSRGPIGYTGWRSATGRHGVIVAGYSNGLRAGPCLVNGELRRLAEVGMQSAFVELGPNDRAGDEVVLLGDGLDAADIAKAWGAGPQEVMVRMGGLGARRYDG
jgi:alanine racemase